MAIGDDTRRSLACHLSLSLSSSFVGRSVEGGVGDDCHGAWFTVKGRKDERTAMPGGRKKEKTPRRKRTRRRHIAMSPAYWHARINFSRELRYGSNKEETTFHLSF